MSESILGISITDRGVQAVEVAKDGASDTLLAIDEWENSITGPDAEAGGAGVARFTEYLSAYMKVNRVKADRASVALDTANLFIHRIPVERGATNVRIEDQIQWELRQYFPEMPVEEFITDFHRMVRFPQEELDEVLIVSLRRRTARTIKSALAALRLRLEILDADHFSAEHALRINYPDSLRRNLAMVGVKETRLDISVLKNGNLESYGYRVVGSNQQIIDEIGELSRKTQGVTSLTVYGPHLDKDLLFQIRRNSSLLVEALNPLRHVNVSDNLRLADHLTVPSYRFASAVGVALRRD